MSNSHSNSKLSDYPQRDDEHRYHKHPDLDQQNTLFVAELHSTVDELFCRSPGRSVSGGVIGSVFASPVAAPWAALGLDSEDERSDFLRA